MKKILKRQLSQGKEVVFDNERTFTDDYRSMECTFRNQIQNSWANGYNISFNGAYFTYKTFDAFFKKLEQLKNDFNLELKCFE